MNKSLAFDNRLCYEREVARQHAIHHQKLQSILPTCQSPSKVYLDNNAPSKQPHLATNAKRLQTEKEKQMLIYLQNQRLAHRMNQILHRQENVVLAAASTARTPLPPSREHISPRKLVHSPAHVHMPGMRLDATQTPLVDCYLSPELSMGRGNACTKQSLVSKTVQKREQHRILQENRCLKQRVQNLKPFYDTKKWDIEWQHHAHKFQHLRQNGTVGYLLPPPPTTRGKLLTSRKPQTSVGSRKKHVSHHGLPLIKREGGHTNRAAQQQQKQELVKLGPQNTIQSSQDMEDDLDGDEDMLQVVECPPCVLLEATTRSGVELTVKELQIESIGVTSSHTIGLGDRGLLIRGEWGEDHIQGECLVGLATLQQTAHELDDLDMMIKLETVTHLSGIGNFPRLSTLLTDEELEKLLLRLVQRTRVEILENRKKLLIETCPARAPHGYAKLAAMNEASSSDFDGNMQHRQQCSRPRTCPSTMPSSSKHSEDLGEEATLNESVHRSLSSTLGLLINDGKRKYGLQMNGMYYLVDLWFDEETSTRTIKVLQISLTESIFRVQVVKHKIEEVRFLIWQMETGCLTRGALVEQEINKLFRVDLNGV